VQPNLKKVGLMKPLQGPTWVGIEENTSFPDPDANLLFHKREKLRVASASSLLTKMNNRFKKGRSLSTVGLASA